MIVFVESDFDGCLVSFGSEIAGQVERDLSGVVRPMWSAFERDAVALGSAQVVGHCDSIGVGQEIGWTADKRMELRQWRVGF